METCDLSVDRENSAQEEGEVYVVGPFFLMSRPLECPLEGTPYESVPLLRLSVFCRLGILNVTFFMDG